MKYLRALFFALKEMILFYTTIRRRFDMFLYWYWTTKKNDSKNAINRFGEKYYSQNDEDGLTLEIIKRLDITKGSFLEIGVGDGTENNTLILLMSGWSGVWIDGNNLNYSFNDKLKFINKYVSPENIPYLINSDKGFDFISIDIDSFDFPIVRSLLENRILPKIFVVEYNGKFPLPISYVYEGKDHSHFSDHMGASLQAFIDLFEIYKYKLLVCNITGINAFFIKEEYLNLFTDRPANLSDIFIVPDYNWFYKCGHMVSKETINDFINK